MQHRSIETRPSPTKELVDEETKQQQKQDSAKQSGFGNKTKYQENR